jgi:hypothetical protein
MYRSIRYFARTTTVTCRLKRDNAYAAEKPTEQLPHSADAIPPPPISPGTFRHATAFLASLAAAKPDAATH